ncbi:GAF and ANTAR domain-containing protein [Streptomyces sp. NBC_00237]|uniref:GAF and ANTAR domain-containing protein n=1 Tax=Streptomyces sp. NBC_00237 TaxID=2975687 RepID=UPI0022527137|nr:GAF and ANTAR domain-containing protein [Streptomyces sp. NBC_00237]MCX5204284.1 GAF and ANTAR domain-containing protein [Streptomyces sp. NBC_00237]
MTTPDQRLADAFVAVADSLNRSYDVPSFLVTLAAWGKELLGVRAVGAVLVLDGARPAHVAGSDPQAALLEQEAAGWQEGAGHDCLHTGDVSDTVLDEASAGLRWPWYAARARQFGYARAAALPLRRNDERVGALVLLRDDAEPLSPGTLSLGRSLTEAATIALLCERELNDSRILTSQLKRALTSRVVIEQAKGVLANRLNSSMDETFALLRRYARSHQLKLDDVATGVVDGTLDLRREGRAPAGTRLRDGPAGRSSETGPRAWEPPAGPRG